MSSMRPSRTLRKLREGKAATCFKINLSCPRAVEIAAMSGFDCVWLCQEHGSNSPSQIEAQIYAAKAWNADTVVRVPRGSYSDLIRPLEMDAAGIMVPHAMNLADAKSVVRATRFHPLGLRALDGGNADGQYCNVSTKDYLAQANRERFVIIQIEDPEPLEELDAICALDGIDVIFFGAGDFSHSIGAPGEFNHPQVLAARKKIAECAARHKKIAGAVTSPAGFESSVREGFRFLSIGADVVGLGNYCRDIISQIGGEPASTERVYGGGK